MPRKMPYRPADEISQTYNDGIIRIFTVTDGAQVGYQPLIHAKQKHKLPYEEQRLGINRLFLGRQHRVEIEKVLRIPRINVSTQDIVRTHDGSWYRINSVQSVDDVRPRSLDLALVAMEEKVEVVE